MARPLFHPDDWLLLPEEERLLANRTAHGRLGFTVLLKFFQAKGRFPEYQAEVSREAITFIAKQLTLPIDAWYDLDWEGRTIKRHRAEIREWCGFREITLADMEAFKRWLVDEVISQEHRDDRLRDALLEHCRTLRIEPPTADHAQRLIQSALHEHETLFCTSIFERLAPDMRDRLDGLLEPQHAEVGEAEWTKWQALKAEPGKAGLSSVKTAAARLRQVREVGLPSDLFKGVAPKLLERYAKRAAVEAVGVKRDVA